MLIRYTLKLDDGSIGYHLTGESDWNKIIGHKRAVRLRDKGDKMIYAVKKVVDIIDEEIIYDE